MIGRLLANKISKLLHQWSRRVTMLLIVAAAAFMPPFIRSVTYDTLLITYSVY